MWLKISFFHDKPSLLAAVGRDGMVYFKASDVGRLLGYASPYKFANRHAITNLKHKVPQHLLSWSTQKSGGVLVFEFREMMEKIEKVVDKRRMHLDYNHIETMRSLWNFGCVHKIFPVSMPDVPGKAFPLKIRMTDEMQFQGWIHRYAQMTRAFFDSFRVELSNETQYMDIDSPNENQSLCSNDETVENNRDEIWIKEELVIDVEDPDSAETFEKEHLDKETRNVDNREDWNEETMINESPETLEHQHSNEKTRENVDVEQEIFRNLKQNVLLFAVNTETGLKIVYDNLECFPNEIKFCLKGTTRVYT